MSFFSSRQRGFLLLAANTLLSTAEAAPDGGEVDRAYLWSGKSACSRGEEGECSLCRVMASFVASVLFSPAEKSEVKIYVQFNSLITDELFIVNLS